MTHHATVPFTVLVIIWYRDGGKRETILANRMMEIPLPMPNSVICSPSHMIRAEPEVKVRMMTIAAQTPWPSAVRKPDFMIM